LDGPAHQIGAVAVGLVPATAVGIAVAGRRGIVRIAPVIVWACAPAALLFVQPGVVLLLVAVLRHAALLLQYARALGVAPFGPMPLMLAIAPELFGALAIGL